jgi:hypothetical protein
MATAAREVFVKSRRVRKQRVPEEEKLARSLGLPGYRAGHFQAVDIANRTDDDQRKMVRSQEMRTLRRTTHIERLASAGTITKDQADICEWYASQHELGYSTIGCTANYGGAGGGGFGSSDLLARYKAQARARNNHIAARAAIPPALRHLFDRVVLHGHGLASGDNSLRPHSRAYSRLSSSFRHACNCLREIFELRND